MKENHASLLVIEQSHSSFDCLQWREIDFRSFDLDLSRLNVQLKFLGDNCEFTCSNICTLE